MSNTPKKFIFILLLLPLIPSLILVIAIWRFMETKSNSSGPPSGRYYQQEKNHSTVPALDPLTPSTLGNPFSGKPWVTDLTIGDLDGDGLLDIVFCEGQLDQVIWLRQGRDGQFMESLITGDIRGPAHVELADVNQDGKQDLLIAAMGKILPDNRKIGSVVILENTGNSSFVLHSVLKDTYRVTDVQAGDLDMDGDIDLAIAQFGYDQGAVGWLENQGEWQFKSHRLLNLSGSIHSPIVDLDQDGDPDIVALVSQEWEEIYYFNNSGGRFGQSVLYGSTNEDYGSSGLSIGDIDRDGDPDIAYTNGDAFDYAIPSDRPWHGIQWLENKGNGFFKFHRVDNFPGAYSPLIIDINGDQNMDLVAVSGFNEWDSPEAVSMMVWLNDGSQRFTPLALAHTPTHLIVVDGADLDGDGKVELVTGGMHAYPPFNHLSRITLWDQ